MMFTYLIDSKNTQAYKWVIMHSFTYRYIHPFGNGWNINLYNFWTHCFLSLFKDFVNIRFHIKV